jgi:hypothetical protein
LKQNKRKEQKEEEKEENQSSLLAKLYRGNFKIHHLKDDDNIIRVFRHLFN